MQSLLSYCFCADVFIASFTLVCCYNAIVLFALTLSVSSSTKITLSASSWQSGMSLELIMWKTPASTEPCGAPLSSQSRRSLVFDSILTHCFLSPRYDWIHSIDASSKLYSFSFFGNRKWSKEGLRSIGRFRSRCNLLGIFHFFRETN